MWQIGGVTIPNRVVSAPMAGITDKPFRLIAREFDCGLIFTEMISDQALLYGQERTRRMIDLTGEKRPIALQLFGSQPRYIGEASRKICELVAPDIIDINMGCPTLKVVKNGEGSALMRDLPRARQIMRAVLDNASCPVTVKMRLGWDENSMNYLELATIAEEEGIAALTLHARTREQFYSGKADWQHIRRLKEMVRVPVIGNGDVWEPGDALRLLRETGCDAVMIGRGALGNPWLFKRTVRYLEDGELLPPPAAEERVAVALHHYRLAMEIKGEEMALREMRKHAAWYTKGLRGSSAAREAINRAGSYHEVEEILRSLAGTR